MAYIQPKVCYPVNSENKYFLRKCRGFIDIVKH